MVHFETGNESNVGKLVGYWDDTPALKMIRDWLEEVFRDFQKELNRAGISDTIGAPSRKMQWRSILRKKRSRMLSRLFYFKHMPIC